MVISSFKIWFIFIALVFVDCFVLSSDACKSRPCPILTLSLLVNLNVRLTSLLLCSKAIHVGFTCGQYKRWKTAGAGFDLAEFSSRALMEQLIQNGKAMRCPRCGVRI